MKKLIAILLSMIIMATFAVTAFAANETSASTTVSYTMEDGYTINIPSSINLNEKSYFDITASQMHMPGGSVWVKIDTSRTAISGNSLELNSSTGKSMHCQLYVGTFMENTTQSLQQTSYQVAVFENTSTTPTKYGKLIFEVYPEMIETGTYTGIISFEIGQ